MLRWVLLVSFALTSFGQPMDEAETHISLLQTSARAYTRQSPSDGCGSNGNNYGAEMQRLEAGSECACQKACSDAAGCAGWTYVPDGMFGMGSNDCVLRSTFADFIDNCGGKCKSGQKDFQCGSNGNNYGAEMQRLQAGSPCACQQACSNAASCAGWTYVPDGMFGMGSDDCVFRSTWEGSIDNCNGKCKSGQKDFECGDNANNWGTELQRVQAGSPCACKQTCSDTASCVGWTYVPNGLFGMGSDDCTLRSTWGNSIDNCDGTCKSGWIDLDDDENVDEITAEKANAQKCANWCSSKKHKSKPWSKKCAWNACATCSECP